jgi:hypothetical protein
VPEFFLLLHEDPTNWGTVSPEEMQRALEQYWAWTRKPFVKGHEHLAEDMGKVIRSRGGVPRVADGPYSETKEVLAGFFVIEAASYDEAVARSLDHPHLAFGTIEVRQVQRHE